MRMVLFLVVAVFGIVTVSTFPGPDLKNDEKKDQNQCTMPKEVISAWATCKSNGGLKLQFDHKGSKEENHHHKHGERKGKRGNNTESGEHRHGHHHGHHHEHSKPWAELNPDKRTELGCVLDKLEFKNKDGALNTDKITKFIKDMAQNNKAAEENMTNSIGPCQLTNRSMAQFENRTLDNGFTYEVMTCITKNGHQHCPNPFSIFHCDEEKRSEHKKNKAEMKKTMGKDANSTSSEEHREWKAKKGPVQKND